jgi:MerR HTH family regulatory protein
MIPSEMLFTAGDVSAITGVHPRVLERWVSEEGVLSPRNAERGGRGRHRLYSLGDVIAVAVGLRFREEGADPGRVREVVRFIAGLGVERLKRELDEGKTLPAPGPQLGVTWLPGLMLDPEKDIPPDTPPEAKVLMRRLNVKPVYEAVMKKVAKLTGVGV